MRQPVSTDPSVKRLFASTVHQTAGQVVALRSARNRIHAGMTGAEARKAIEDMIGDLEHRIGGGMTREPGHA